MLHLLLYLIHDTPDSPETKLLGCQISLCPDRVREANPITYIDNNDPPFKLYHGTFDCSVPPYQSIALDSALKAAEVFSSLSLLEHIGHAFRPNSEDKLEMLEFLNTHLTGLTSISDKNNIPLAFELEQNYPNPFNPSTTIKYTIPTSGHVTLKVFDMLGREVTTLVNESKPTGEYEIEFDAANLTSGVYFYQLKTSSSVITKKLMVVR